MWDPIEQVVHSFGRQGLQRACKDAVSTLNIPDNSKHFLLDVGLPMEVVLLCEFSLDAKRFPTIEEYALLNGLVLHCPSKFRRIGTDGYMQICICENDGFGKICAFDIHGKINMRYMNRNIECFCGFLGLYVDACKKYADASEEEMHKGAVDLENKYRSLDSDAYDSKDNWWPLITEQLKDGLL
jgi:hypothetical protein